jgi:hypothetical protein
MDVFDYGGTYVGQINAIQNSQFFFGTPARREIAVPLQFVLAVLDDRALLTVTVAQLRSRSGVR